MATKLYPTDVTDRQWEVIKELIPAPAVRGRKRELDMRQVINALLYVVVGGVQWRLLPREYPNRANARNWIEGSEPCNRCSRRLSCA